MIQKVAGREYFKYALEKILFNSMVVLYKWKGIKGMNAKIKRTGKTRFILFLIMLLFLLSGVNSQAATKGESIQKEEAKKTDRESKVSKDKESEETEAKSKKGSLKKVRVGYLIYPGYQEGEGDAPKTGYGYEYLQQIAYYAGWEYEYVNGGFNELLEMLKKGQIDIMGDLSYTEERAKDINYAKEEQGREYYYLFVREDRTDISATDLSTLKNAKIGINKGSVQVDLFKKWCKKNNVQCQIELYSNSEERYADMNSGKLDAIVSTTVAEKEILKYHWNSILKIGYSPYYFAVSKKNPQLYKELNAAITQILQSDWYYNEEVYLKYNGKTSAASASLDGKDKEWLESKGEIKVGYIDNTLPYSSWNKNNGEVTGLLSKFVSHMKERYNAEFKPVRFSSYKKMAEALSQGEIDTAFPVYGSYWVAEQNDLMVTGDLTSSYLMLVYKDTYDAEKTSVIAVVEDSSLQQFCVKEHYPDARTVSFKSMDECLNAVESGKVSCTLMCSDTYYAHRNEFENISRLNISNTGYEVPISFATRREDVQMYSFLKKGLASLKDTDIHEALIAEDYANPEMNVRQFLQKHVFLVIIVMAVVIALILLLLIYYIVSRRKAIRLSKSNSELNEKAYIDIATGLPNKNKCEEMLSAHLTLGKPTACFMLDLNDLKKVNDTLGHEMGDIMILNFAKLLRKVVPLQYFVGRFGGDEFIVIAEDISGKEEAEGLVQEIKDMILKFNGLRGEFKISYACGYALSEDYPEASLTDLLNEADIKMYEDKIRSKVKF